MIIILYFLFKIYNNSIRNTQFFHIRPKRLDLRNYWNAYIDLIPLSFERAKESLAKKTLPLVKNCLKFFRNGSKNFNSSFGRRALPKSSDRKFLLLPLLRIFYGNFSQAGLFFKTKLLIQF